MNRQQELQNLMHELENTPEEMTQMSPKTKIRARKRKIIKGTLMPPAVFAVMLLMIVAMVNISPTIAHAFEQVPVLRQIATAVNFSPSLTDAIQHEFVQHIGLEQTIDGITMRVEYIIVDQRQLNIFYTLHSPDYTYLSSWRPSVRCVYEETHLPVAIFSGSVALGTGEIRQIVANFFDEQMPDSLVFELLVQPLGAPQMSVAVPADAPPPTEWVHTEPEGLVRFAFTLEFDPTFTEQGETLHLYHDFVLDGQRMTLTTVEIYPTHMRINLTACESNTAWLRSLHFFAENERGHRFDTISNGITAFGTTGSPMMVSHVLHSPFFAESRELTLFIEEVEWLDKDMERGVRVCLASETAEMLPEGVTLYEARWDGRSWHLAFAIVERAENHSHSVFMQEYFNENGDAFHFTSWASGMRRHYPPENFVPYVFFVEFALVDFPYDVVYLSPSYSRLVRFSEPVMIRLAE